jgi:hypothetical protein
MNQQQKKKEVLIFPFARFVVIEGIELNDITII